MSELRTFTTATLVISCPDKVGIVAAISNFVAQRQGSLIESNHHTDIEQEWFFMRNVINVDALSVSLDKFREEFQALALEFDMQWYLRDNQVLQRVVIMASHAYH